MKEIENKSNLYVIGCVLLVVIAIGLAVIPLNRSLATARKQAQEKTLQAESLEKKISILTSVQKGLNADQKRKQQLEIAVPTDTKLDEIFIMLETMATEAGVQIDNIMPVQGDKSTSGLNEIAVTLKGEFSNLVNFSQLVKGNLRPMFVKSVIFSAEQSKDGKTTLAATFTLKVLTAKQNNVKETIESKNN